VVFLSRLSICFSSHWPSFLFFPAYGVGLVRLAYYMEYRGQVPLQECIDTFHPRMLRETRSSALNEARRAVRYQSGREPSSGPMENPSRESAPVVARRLNEFLGRNVTPDPSCPNGKRIEVSVEDIAMVAGKSQTLMERELRLHRHNEDFAAAGKHLLFPCLSPWAPVLMVLFFFVSCPGFFRQRSSLDRTFEALAIASNPDLPSDLSGARVQELLKTRDGFRDGHKKLFCTGDDRGEKIERMETEALAKAPIRRGPAVKRVVKNPNARRSAPPAAPVASVAGPSSATRRGKPPATRKSSVSARRVLSVETIEDSEGAGFFFLPLFSGGFGLFFPFSLHSSSLLLFQMEVTVTRLPASSRRAGLDPFSRRTSPPILPRFAPALESSSRPSLRSWWLRIRLLLPPCPLALLVRPLRVWPLLLLALLPSRPCFLLPSPPWPEPLVPLSPTRSRLAFRRFLPWVSCLS
jgi:hypothetical protein